jgi:hypothetical protein
VRGKVALVEGIAIPGKVQLAEEAGAAACVLANADEHVHEVIVSTVWASPTLYTRDELPRIAVVYVNATGGEALREALQETGPTTVHLRTRVSTGWTEISTLIAQVDGTEEPERFAPGDGMEARADGTLMALADFWRHSIKQHMGIWRALKLKRRKTEVHMQVAPIILTGQEHSIATPANAAVLDVIYEVEGGKRGMGWENLEEISHHAGLASPAR